MIEGFFKTYREDLNNFNIYHRDGKYAKVWLWLNDHKIFNPESKRKDQVVLTNGLQTILEDLTVKYGNLDDRDDLTYEELRSILRFFRDHTAIFYERINLNMTIIIIPKAKSKIKK